MRPPLSVLLQTAAVSVATVLGVGILGLPVSLYASGLRPFLLTFTLNLFAQLGIVTAVVELLQRAHEASPPTTHAYAPANPDDSPTSPLSARPPAPPSLHSLSEHFLRARPLRFFFNLFVISHFICILIAYGLAGPQAFAALIPPLKRLPFWSLTTIFVVVLAAAVVFIGHALLPSLTVATVAKSLLLTILVFVIFVRGWSIRQPVSNNWNPGALVDPFLMGTFALSGIANLMPVTFQACLDATKGEDGRVPKIDRAFVRGYRLATVLALVLCYILNVIWSVAMLMCVPQTNAAATEIGKPDVEEAHRRTVMDILMRGMAIWRQANVSSSLQEANELGQISTIPLIEVLHARHDKMDSMIAFLVNVFIALSITVSFLVMSMGAKHYIDGESRSQASNSSRIGYDSIRRLKYALYFSFILFIAIGNPAALMQIMAGITGLAVNVECGLMLIYMLYAGRRMTKEIPAPLSTFHTSLLIGFVTVYFSIAIIVDVFFFLPAMFTSR